ncbi:MAG: hypothetical protein V3W18_14845 [candidate division Zixibacteria bacterium]
MKINGFDSSLPPPDNGKGQNKKQPVEKQVKADSIELSASAKKEASSGESSPVQRGADVDKTQAGFSGYKAPSTPGANKVSPENRVAAGLEPAKNTDIVGDRIEISVSAQRAEKIALVRMRIESGYYNQPENIEKLADILIDKLNLKNTENN